MEEDYIIVLWHEFFAEEGSFLVQLRVDRHWDKAAFDRLTEAMRICCKKYEQEQQTEEQRMQAITTELPRWLASGFWYFSHFVRDWTSHPAWKEEYTREPDYFNHAYKQLDELALWFFEGLSPYRSR